MEFLETFAAIITGNMLTAMFLYGIISYTRLEGQNRISEVTRPIYISIFLPLLFMVFAVWAVLD